MIQIAGAITAALARLLDRRAVIVLCPNGRDAAAWRALLAAADAPHLVIPLDAPDLIGDRTATGPTGYLDLHHDTIAALTAAPSLLDDFDPQERAVLIIPDPLRPRRIGRRPCLGCRQPAWTLAEDKMLVDQLWDLAHIPRAESLTCDLGPGFAQLTSVISDGCGVVASVQRRGGAPNAGGEGIWWWREDMPDGFPHLGEGMRARLMPLLEGIPCRVHGMVLGGRTAVFPPMELLSLPRPDRGTFLWAGAVPLGRNESELEKAARRVGTFLNSAFAYRGPFAADGILTGDGFLPTELTTRLTSAFEGADPFVRVMLHAATILARESAGLPVIEDLAATALASDTIDVYGLATRASEGASECSIAWAADGPHLSAQPVHGHMTLRPWGRGWQLHARLNLADLPGRPVGMHAPQLFALADKTFGTDFGTVTPPFGLTVPAPRQS